MNHNRTYNKIIDGKKKCSKCLRVLPIEDFEKRKGTKSGISYRCEICAKEYKKQYRIKNKERETERSIEYQKKYPKKVALNSKRHRDTDEYREKAKRRMRDRRKKDISFRISSYIRSRIGLALHGIIKSDRTKNLLGCSIEEFKNYLSKKFHRGMSWENHGSFWHIDHIIPCASFDLSDPRQQEECFHYTNCQPLLKKENFSKNSKYISKGKIFVEECFDGIYFKHANEPKITKEQAQENMSETVLRNISKIVKDFDRRLLYEDYKKQTLQNFVDEIGTIQHVIISFPYSYGIDIYPIFAEIYRSYTKEFGKTFKYKPPNLKWEVERQAKRAYFLKEQAEKYENT